MSLPYYQMYPRDFETDERVRLMGLAEIGLYVTCLNHAWANDGLPSDPSLIQKMLKIPSGQFAASWPWVEPCFKLASDGRLRNPRQEMERELANASLEMRTERAKAGARARWKNATSNASEDSENMLRHKQAMPRASESVSGVSSEIQESTSTARAGLLCDPESAEPAEPRKSLQELQEQWFTEEFWPAYWRKVDKAAALASFIKHARNEQLKNRIVAAVVAHAPQYSRRDPEHRPHASTWLNKRRYEEPPEDLSFTPPPSRIRSVMDGV